MNKLFFALMITFSLTALQASKEPPCNHESLDEAWGDNDSGKDDKHSSHHHH